MPQSESVHGAVPDLWEQARSTLQAQDRRKTAQERKRAVSCNPPLELSTRNAQTVSWEHHASHRGGCPHPPNSLTTQNFRKDAVKNDSSRTCPYAVCAAGWPS